MYPLPSRHLMAKFGTTSDRMTFGKMYPLPRKRYLMAKCVTALVRLTSGHMYPHPKIRLWIRLTFGQASDHSDLRSDVPPKTSGGQV